MKSVIRVFLYDDDYNRFFGEGPCRLLHAIEETGSLRAAAASMNMAYTKAFSMIKRAEKSLAFPLTETITGGRGGGGDGLLPPEQSQGNGGNQRQRGQRAQGHQGAAAGL